MLKMEFLNSEVSIADLNLKLTDASGRGIPLPDFDEYTNQVDVDVTDGIYKIRTELGGLRKDKVVRVQGNTRVEIGAPGIYTPTPISGAATSHEYFEGPATYLASSNAEYTARHLGDAVTNPGEILVVIRPIDMEKNPESVDLGSSLFLFGMNNNEAIRLSRSNCYNVQHGFHGFKVKAEAGTYFLSDSEREFRGLFIQVLPHSQTQVFITYWERPILEEAGIFISQHQRGFIPSDEATVATDLAIRGLINGTEQIPRRQMNYLLHGKFESPMLGLLAAFTILMRNNPNWELLDTVCQNLDYMIGGSTDLEILKAVLSTRDPNGRDWHYEKNLQSPPMLRAATEWAIRITWQDAEFIGEDSLLEDVTADSGIPSAWTMWKPSGTRLQRFESWKDMLTSPKSSGLGGGGGGPDRFAAPQAPLTFDSQDKEMMDLIADGPSGGRSDLDWIKSAITEWLQQTKQVAGKADEVALSKSLGIPRRLISNALRQLNQGKANG